MGYLHSIHKEFLQTIKKRQETIFEPQLRSNKVSKETFINSLYRNTLLEGKKRAYLVNFKNDKTKNYSCDTLEHFLEMEHKFTFYTPNVYYHPRQRTKERLTSLNAIVLDFDLSKDGTHRAYTPDELAYIIYNEFDLYPHFIYETKTIGNYQAKFLINPMRGNESSVYLYESIVKRMAILTGSDFAATDSTNLYRLPTGDIHNYESIMNIYDIDDFKFVLDNEEINSRLEQERKAFLRGKSNVISFSEHQLINQPAIQKLINCEIEDYRNHAAFTLALFFYSLNKDQADVERFFLENWHPKANSDAFSSTFSKRELKDCIKSAFSGKYSGASKEWIEFITGEDFHFSVYRSSYIKKSEEERKYLSKNTLRTRLLNWIKENPQVEVKQQDLAMQLDVAYSSLKLQIKKLVEENIIELHTQRGRNKGSVFVLKDTAFTIEEADTKYSDLNHLFA